MLTPNIAPIAEAWHNFFNPLYLVAGIMIISVIVFPLIFIAGKLLNKLINHISNN